MERGRVRQRGRVGQLERVGQQGQQGLMGRWGLRGMMGWQGLQVQGGLQRLVRNLGQQVRVGLLKGLLEVKETLELQRRVCAELLVRGGAGGGGGLLSGLAAAGPESPEAD